MNRHRYRRIVFFFARILIRIVIWDLLLPRLGFRKWSRRTRPERLRRAARDFRTLAIHLGGVLIKVGQFLSSRVDVLPTEIITELAGLQDEVPPEKFADIQRVAEEEFGLPLGEIFSQFDEVPLAAASLGQVHQAQIKMDDTEPEKGYKSVVVKIQRPKIETIIATDLAALSTVGNWIRRYRPIRLRADIPALLAEFTRILYEEIDYLAEGRNAEIFAKNFEGDDGVRVPGVEWTHTTKRVLTLENVLSIKITDYGAITDSGIERSDVASRLFTTYLKQFLEDGFFHADPHPGNLFVQPGLSKEFDGKQLVGDTGWQLTFVDFGMVGRIPPNMIEGLRELIIAVGTKDAARMVKSYKMLGLLLPSANLALLEKAEAKAFERFWGKSMSELRNLSHQDMREFASEFRELIYTMPFQIPHDFIFLGRAISILAGMCIGLDPEFNLWEHISPYAQKLIASEALSTRELLMNELKNFVVPLLAAPRKIETILGKMERGELEVRIPEVHMELNRLERMIRQAVGSIIFAALLLGGIQLFLAGYGTLSNLLFWGAGLSLVWVIINGLRG